MDWRKRVCCFLGVVVVWGSVLGGMEGSNVMAAGEGEMRHLIQVTSLEEDYRGAAKLGLLVTRKTVGGEVQEAFENVLCSCVRIKVEGHYGSGSIYKMLEDDIIIVTNRHVLQYWNEDSYVTFFNGRAAGGALLGVSEEADLGFIRIPTKGFTYEELLAFRNIRIPQIPENETVSEKVPAEGSKLFLVDIASKWNTPVMMEGQLISPLIYLEDFQTEMLYAKGEAIPGMSGGGIFDAYGNYLGMLTGATLQNELAAVPAETITKEYENIISNKE
ncbi:MAG: trypsin-like peptidase domain-containing protein [Lachnospiraceae bacterium]|nr:trypsin-like peptidase domain-containing protein [Lachnospiraceae bacterium]